MSFNPWLIILMGIISGLLTAHFAMRKGRNALPWFIIGFFTGWFLGLLIIYFMPPTGLSAPKVELKTAPETKKNIPAIPTNGWYLLDDNWQEQGPMSHEQLLRALQQHSSPQETFLWHPTLINWTPLANVAGLQDPSYS